jgi:hypothetical protein
MTEKEGQERAASTPPKVDRHRRHTRFGPACQDESRIERKLSKHSPEQAGHPPLREVELAILRELDVPAAPSLQFFNRLVEI